MASECKLNLWLCLPLVRNFIHAQLNMQIDIPKYVVMFKSFRPIYLLILEENSELELAAHSDIIFGHKASLIRGLV